MNKISIEEAEKLSPPELVELIINNVPFNKIRSCLTNIQETLPPPPALEPEVLPPVKPSGAGSSSSSSNMLTSLRTMCKDDPIIIVETGKKIKGKDEAQVIYYAKSKKTGKIMKFSLDESKFNKQTCSKLGEPLDLSCQAIDEWIDEQLAGGKDTKQVRKVIEDYISSGINLYLTKCPQFENIKFKLGMGVPQPAEISVPVKPIELPEQKKDLTSLSALEISRLITPITDVLVYPKERKNNQIRVSYYDSNDRTWISKDVSKDFISTRADAFVSNTPEYRLRENALEGLEVGSPKYQNLNVIIKELKKNGIQLPYGFFDKFFT